MSSTKDFLGTGWSFPINLSGGMVTLASEEVKIAQSIRTILGTLPGERVMEPEFGCALNELVFAPQNESTFNLAAFYVQQALGQWESRIRVTNVRAAPDPRFAGVMNIAIDYVVLSKNQRQNLVYPFYLQHN